MDGFHVGLRYRFTPTRVGSTRRAEAGVRRPTVHPHTRGEHGIRNCSANSSTGSPPHAWGALREAAPDHVRDRFTPTRVGSTGGRAPTCISRAVHPHTRGEHFVRIASSFFTICGSPPHAWGALNHHQASCGIGRLTPTRVGSTLPYFITSPTSAVHPHTRGEHVSIPAEIFAQFGSPPHAWGARHRDRSKRSIGRFTPTRVGSTCQYPRRYSLNSVHPHTRGEHQRGVCTIRLLSGSPPHAWGARRAAIIPTIASRFTPTRVGSTAPRPPIRPSWPVHPHTRGEHAAILHHIARERGSPPHVWGARVNTRGDIRSIRFTPTRVGSTPSSSIPSPAPTVHPHTRGEHVVRVFGLASSLGSPPHAWGALANSPAGHIGIRFTPTRVGSTSRPSRWR